MVTCAAEPGEWLVPRRDSETRGQRSAAAREIFLRTRAYQAAIEMGWLVVPWPFMGRCQPPVNVMTSAVPPDGGLEGTLSISRLKSMTSPIILSKYINYARNYAWQPREKKDAPRTGRAFFRKIRR
jgi:hypothetical protein